MQNTAVRSDRLVKLWLCMYAQGQHHIDVKVALAELQVLVADRGTIWRNKDLDHTVLDLVAQFIGLGFVERDNKITQRIGIFLDRFFGLQKFEQGRYLPAKNSSGVLAHFIECQRHADTSCQLVN